MTRATPQTGRYLRGLLPAACCFTLAAGCAGLTGARNTTPPPAVDLNKETPTAEALVAYLNRTSAKLTALESKHLDIDIQADKQAFGLKGALHCQTPKNFRMIAKIMAMPEADFGSNDQEFWYWIKHDQPPYLYHCSYTDLERGGVRMPFPLQPEWVLEALGMATLNPQGTYEVHRRDRYLDLTERTTSPQGQPVTKVTRLNNFTASGTTPQVVGRYLYDAQNRIICSAVVSSVQTDPATGAVIPHKIKLEWPEQKMSMSLVLGEVVVNRPRTDLPELYRRPPGYTPFDLARGTIDGKPSSIRSAGGIGR